ncbi:hypothetical protein [Enterobacillus tribolii]|uniref:Uncharacterized protein n=1 Tax=Enterobacillus tribolii TaxID=1487935 RepID=A0A370R2G5_9GAMM|nr:hypothetical protein [Enterobacillus tribolii]MBW7983677.1 hypothetical protein [Enterobacillus tribolii]RDK96606.1 hypothetical protein C8D90_10134 [Enterobacillus tribolii]
MASTRQDEGFSFHAHTGEQRSVRAFWMAGLLGAAMSVAGFIFLSIIITVISSHTYTVERIYFGATSLLYGVPVVAVVGFLYFAFRQRGAHRR